MTELDSIVKALKRKVEELYDAQVRQRRLLADLLYNLDEENMPAVKEIISRYRTENGEAIAAISLRTDENAAAVSVIAQHQKDMDSTVAGIDAKADANAASITQIAKVQTEQEKTVASIGSKADANAARIEQVALAQDEYGESIASIESKADANSAGISQLASAQTEQGKSISSVDSKANANAASIGQLASVQTEQGKSISSVESKANANAASIGQLASVQTEQGKSIAAIEAKVDEESSEIRLEVQRIDEVAADAAQNAGYARDEASAAQSTADSASEAASSAQSTANEAKANSSNGAYIIARINADGSIVKISADKLELSGYATFASLENEGTTSINGANIMTGTVDADVLKTGGVGQTGTMLGNNLMFNAGAVKYSDAEARYLFFVDPALYNVFIGVEGGSDAKILRIHSEGNGLFDSYNGERLYLGSIAPGNDLVTRSEVSDMIAAALEGLDVPTEIYAPHISPESGDYAMPVTVEITNYNSTGDVYYTISGAGNADGTYLYTGPFDIYDTVEDYVTVSAYCRTDHGDSEEVSVSYYLSA